MRPIFRVGGKGSCIEQALPRVEGPARDQPLRWDRLERDPASIPSHLAPWPETCCLRVLGGEVLAQVPDGPCPPPEDEELVHVDEAHPGMQRAPLLQAPAGRRGSGSVGHGAADAGGWAASFLTESS